MSTTWDKNRLEEELEQVQLADFLSEHTHKIRRNLIAASAIGVIIGTYNKVPAFVQQLPLDALSGLLTFAIAFWCVSFVFGAGFDFAGWRFKKTIIEALPFLESIEMLARRQQGIGEQLSQLHSILTERYDSEIELDREQHKKDVMWHLQSYREQIEKQSPPEFSEWVDTIHKFRGLTTRTAMRKFSFLFVDVGIPYALAILSLWLNADGVCEVIDAVTDAI